MWCWMSAASCGVAANTSSGSAKSSRAPRSAHHDLARPRRVADDHLVEHDCRRVHVGRCDDLAAALLRRHVGERADRLRAPRDRRDRAVGIGQVGDAEVAEHDLDAGDVGVAAEHEVAGLDVAMHDATAMRGGERRRGSGRGARSRGAASAGRVRAARRAACRRRRAPSRSGATPRRDRAPRRRSGGAARPSRAPRGRTARAHPPARSPRGAACSSLTATSRSSSASRARYTTPVAPRPSSRTSR